MYDNEVEALCNICKDTFYVEKNAFTAYIDKIVGICEDCHDGYINGNAIPPCDRPTLRNRLTDLS